MTVTGSSAAAMFQAEPSAALERRVAGGAMSAGPAAARKAVDQFVGETFFGALMKEFRKSVSNDHLLSGGPGEATLQPYLDQVLVERMAQSRQFGLSKAMFEMIYRDTAYSPVVSAERVSAEMKERP